jgi:hypothetical protein
MNKKATKQVGTRKSRNEASDEMDLLKKDQEIMRNLCDVFDQEVGKTSPTNWNAVKQALASNICSQVDKMTMGEKNVRLAHMIWDLFCGFLGSVDPESKGKLRADSQGKLTANNKQENKNGR